MNKEELEDYKKLSGEITEKLDNTAEYENWLIIQEYVDRLQHELEQERNIRKEAIEYIREKQKIQYKYALSLIEIDDLLEILNKEVK